jgi:hypothetical protein
MCSSAEIPAWIRGAGSAADPHGGPVLLREKYEQNPQMYPDVTVVKAGTRIQMESLHLLNQIWGKMLLVYAVILDGEFAGRRVEVNELCNMNFGKEYRELIAVNGEYLTLQP